MYSVDERNYATRIIVSPPTPPLNAERALGFEPEGTVKLPLPIFQSDNVTHREIPLYERKKETHADTTTSAPYVTAHVSFIDAPTVPPLKLNDTGPPRISLPSVLESISQNYHYKSDAPTAISRSLRSVQISSPRTSSGRSSYSRLSSQDSLSSDSPKSSRFPPTISVAPNGNSQSKLSQDSGRGQFPSVIIHDNMSLSSLGADEFEGDPLASEDADVFPDSATSGLAPDNAHEGNIISANNNNNRKRQNQGRVLPPSVIVVKDIVNESPFSSSSSSRNNLVSPVVDDDNHYDTLPTGSCLFSRTFDQELDVLEEVSSVPPVRLASTPTASMFAEASSSVRDFVGYHYPGDFLPRIFWNYNLGKLIALTRFDSVTGESGTVLYSETNHGKFGRAERREWEYRGRIVSTVWEATPKLRGRGKDALQTLYIKTLSKNDPRQLYNPLFLHTLRSRCPQFPELIGEWETMNLHVVVVRNCGLVLERRKLWDRIVGKNTLDVDWPSFIR